MRQAITLPELGLEDVAARVGGWLVDLDDGIIAGDVVAEVLLPGITFDVAATHSGHLVEIAKMVDARVASGGVLGWIEVADDEFNGHSRPMADECEDPSP